MAPCEDSVKSVRNKMFLNEILLTTGRACIVDIKNSFLKLRCLLVRSAGLISFSRPAGSFSVFFSCTLAILWHHVSCGMWLEAWPAVSRNPAGGEKYGIRCGRAFQTLP